MSAPKNLNRELRDALYRELLDANGEGACTYCGKRVHRTSKLSDRRRATLDHIHPKALGGLNELTNIALACAPCNSRKGSLSADLFRRIRRRR